VAPDGSLYVSDAGNNAVRRIDNAGTITTVAGNRKAGYAGDGGPATQARLWYPAGLLIHDGTLYIADASNDRLRMVDLAAGTITSMPAYYYRPLAPQGLAMRAGRLLLADTGHHTVVALRLPLLRTVGG
jgi:sugar lactone lactonase YvrE